MTDIHTSVTELLAANGIAYHVKPHTQPVFTCEDAARERGVRVSQIVKCMVGRDTKSGRVYVMLIPGDKLLKLKKARNIAGGVAIELMQSDDLVHEFGVTVGAISPTQFIGHAEFLIDNTVFKEMDVDISSGRPDAGVELSAEALATLLGAKRCDIISTH